MKLTLGKLSETVRAGLRTAAPELRKAYVKLFVDKVVISKTDITTTDPKHLLAKAALTDMTQTPAEVITFVREWRAVSDNDEHYVYATATQFHAT